MNANDMERFVLWHRILPNAFDEEETAAAAGQWSRYVTSELTRGGGEVLSSLAGTVVAHFPLRDLKSAINLALRLLAEAESQPVPAGGLPIAFGIASGSIARNEEDTGQLPTGGNALDRAQLLSNQARAGEVVLDVESREAASRTYLFGRTVSTSSFALRGEAIDRNRPLLEDCRRAVGLLQPAPAPSALREALEPIRAAAAGPHSRAFYLKGPLGLGASSCLRGLREELRPPVLLEIGAVPGGLEPLGSLRLALLKSWRALEPSRRSLKGSEPHVAEALKAIACATPPPRAAAIDALQSILQTLGRGGLLPWIYIDRLSAVDPGTLDVLGAALGREASAALLVVRTNESSIPAELRGITPSITLDLPSLEPREALSMASAILGPDADFEVAKQLVITGGLSMLGITEAARTMIATGDLVHDGHRFVFRDEHAERRQFLGPRALLEERFGILDSSSMRFLEIACAALPASSAQVIDVAVALDGIAEDPRRRALAALINDGLLTPQAKPASELLRRAIVQRMPPARRTEVYRFVAQALHSAEPLVGPSMAATVGAYLCEGGDLERGTSAILEAGSLAARLGYGSAAVRLAAAAVQYKPDSDTRSVASDISRAVRVSSGPPDEEDPDRPTMPVVGAPSPHPPIELVRALQDGDHARFDALIDASIAAGGDLTGAHCLRVFSYVARRDLDAAKDALTAAATSPDQGTTSKIRFALASACLHLAHGRARDAMIDALEALAMARTRQDESAEAAAFQMVSVASAAAGLRPEAEGLEHAAGPVAS